MSRHSGRGPGRHQPPRAAAGAMALPLLLALAAQGAISSAPLAAQALTPTKEEDEILKAGPKDPFTDADPELMAAAGIVGYGPFPWADFLSTTDIDKVLGENRVLWVETAHFKVGCNLKSVGWPDDMKKRKALQEELKDLHKLLPKLPEKPKKLLPWIRVHLFAKRIEQCYADVQKLLGVTDKDFAGGGAGGAAAADGDGPFLGQKDKFLVLLFQKKSDMARYMDRFCGVKNDSAMRLVHKKTNQMLAAVAVESFEGFDDAGLYGHVAYAVVHNLMDGYKGFRNPLPLWFGEGISHWYSRKTPSDMLNVQILDTEAVAEDEKQVNWPVKVRRRAQHDGTWIKFAEMATWDDYEKLGYQAHSQAWSRIDYLMTLDAEKVGLMLQKLKSLPPPADGGWSFAAGNALAVKLLAELFEFDADTFDAKWREWVLKTYPKK